MHFPHTVKNTSRLIKTASVLALTVALAACGEQANDSATNEGTDSNATNTTASSSGGAAFDSKITLNGAGASFPAPLYTRWFAGLNKKNPNLQVNYQSVGSGAGVKQFVAGTVDFGASDVAMKDEEIQKVSKGVLLLPMTAGSIVLAYNVPGVTDLKLSREAYVDILLAKITKWNDPKIAAANPGVNLPDKDITVVHRSDGSGTTGVFTKHLSAVSPEWKEKVGAGKTVPWPKGIGAKGNEGITAQLKQTEGSIGYVEYGYAKQNGLTYAALENKSGKFIVPTDESAAKTLDAVTLPENFRAFIVDPEGEDSYPVVTYSWILAYKTYDDPVEAKAMEVMIQYGLNEGQEVSKELGYVPLPDSVKEKVAKAADAISKDFQIAVDGNSTTASK
ncbi:MAG: phosphate ABC transporter substrate-binding protein PstS [Cyanobacteria bacterium P01_A01_bin.84]